MHDESIDRVAGVHGLISEMTFEQLQKIPLKDNETIPTLDSVFDSMAAKSNVILDLKEEGLTDDLAQLIHTCAATKGWRYEQFFATGFEHRELKKLHDLIMVLIQLQ